MHILLQITQPGATQAVQTVTTAVADTTNQVAAAAATPVALPPDSFNLLSMVAKGGPMMIPMGFLFVLSIYVLIERLIIISKASKKNDGLLTGLQSL
ncbi:MAG TPA: hypothetical protein VKG26_15115, partial [Bacteroidia bacterium]|nr:hypothetical protein [Bacteroidia bacterium]